VVLKARRHGYDGQGTFVLNDIDALKQTDSSGKIWDVSLVSIRGICLLNENWR